MMRLSRDRARCPRRMTVSLLMLVGSWFCCLTVLAGPLEMIEMEVGQTRVLSVPGLLRVAVGTGDIVQAVAVDGKEVVLFARKEGGSSVHVWRQGGSARAYRLNVLPQGFARMRDELQQLLAGMPQLRFTVIGSQIAIEGSGLTEQDKQRIEALMQRYPAVLDFTDNQGWEEMVMLDVQVVELPRTRMRELGLRWGVQSEVGVAQAQWLRGGAGGLGLSAYLGARLQFLAQRGEAVFLAQPQLLARSGSSASFLAGGEVPYTATDANGRSQTHFKPYGVSLTITPRIDPQGSIRSRIEVEASSIDPTLTAAAGPAMRVRRAATEFNVPSGQTLVLGGFLSRERDISRHGLPGLSDLPIVGALFGEQRQQWRETELVIIVTPTRVRADDPGLRQRVQRAQAHVQRAFPEPLLLAQDPPVGMPGTDTKVDWSRPEDPSSQWVGQRAPVSDGREP